ncbi:MAG: peptidylprolyl isomerase [Bdellovibrionota bacterium]
MKFFILILISFIGANVQAETVDKIVAIVNDEILTLKDIENYKRQLQKGKFVDDLLISDKEKILKDRNALIDHMINERLIDSEVKRQDLSVTVEKVDQEIKKVSDGNKMTRAQLIAALKAEGISFSDYQNFIKQRLERQALIQKTISSKIKITDDEIQNYYMNNYKGNSVTSYEYSLAHILFLPKGGDKEAAKSRAESVLKKLSAGESFDSLASQFSEDPNFSSGGFLGNFKSGEFLKELETSVQNLSVGANTGVVPTKFGYHIVKLISKKIVKDSVFESKKKEIQNILYEKAFAQQFKFWIEERKLGSFIKINK